MQQIRVDSNRPQILIQLQLAYDRLAPRRLQLRLKQFHDTAQNFIHLHRLKLRMRHSRKLTEAADDRLQVRDLSEQSARTLAEYFIELLGTLRPRSRQIFNRELKREQRILQLMSQSARQFAPSRDRLGLHQAFLLR